jgi:hypothetical protein
MNSARQRIRFQDGALAGVGARAVANSESDVLKPTFPGTPFLRTFAENRTVLSESFNNYQEKGPLGAL